MSASTSLALIALPEAALPNAESVAAELAHPDEPTAAVASQSPSAFTLSIDGATANVTLVDKPIPWSRLEGPCATAWYWPEAEAVLRPHTQHLFVTLLDEGAKPIDASFRLTRLLVAIGAHCPALGFVWGASGGVHEPHAFADLAARSSREDLPLHLWIDFRVYQRDDADGFGFFTTGMEALGRRELEIARFAGDPQRLIAAAYNIAHYALEKDATFKDSEVIGLPDESQVTIREDRSQIDPEQDVYRLEFEPTPA